MSDFFGKIMEKAHDAKSWMDDQEQRSAQRELEFNQKYNPSVVPQPGDETKPANNLRNMVMQKINQGLGTDFKDQTVAEEKQAYASLPREMGMSAGSISKTGAFTRELAEQAALKLENAVAKGYKPTAAEGLAVSKFRGQQAIVPTAQEASGLRARVEAKAPDIRDVADQFNKPASTLSIQNGKPVKKLPFSGGSGI